MMHRWDRTLLCATFHQKPRCRDPHSHTPSTKPGQSSLQQPQGENPEPAPASGGWGWAVLAAEREGRCDYLRRLPQPSPAAPHSPRAGGGHGGLESTLQPRDRISALNNNDKNKKGCESGSSRLPGKLRAGFSTEQPAQGGRLGKRSWLKMFMGHPKNPPCALLQPFCPPSWPSLALPHPPQKSIGENRILRNGSCCSAPCFPHTQKNEKMGSENKVKPCFGCLVSPGSTGRKSTAGAEEGTPSSAPGGTGTRIPSPP